MVTKETVAALNTRMLDYFVQISAIHPRGSQKEHKCCDYLMDFARQHGLEAHHQSTVSQGHPINNVVIKKPGSPGYENAETVILQGHMDMVCQKAPDSAHDFDAEPIRIREADGRYTSADGTTLGADDGIGVACALAILASSDLAHPPLEALFTSGEEDGMRGAAALDTSLVSGRRLINIDSEEEGLFFYGCAGGVYARLCFDYTEAVAPEGWRFYTLHAGGLLGGHSGIMIDQNRANANQLMGRVLHALGGELLLCGLSGGSFPNAIPDACTAHFASPLPRAQLQERLDAIAATLRHEYAAVEKDLTLTLTEAPAAPVLRGPAATGLVPALLTLPNGVFAMSSRVPGLVETSSNLALIEMLPEQHSCRLTCFIRSSVASRKAMVVTQMEQLAQALGARFATDTDNPEWEPDPDSALLRLFRATYERCFGTAPQAAAVHAGLECGYFARLFPGMDLISVGPTITGIHTPDEALELDTTLRLAQLLAGVLEQMK